MNQKKNQTKRFYGVVVNTEYGTKAIACRMNRVPTKFDILRFAEREHELELRKRHLPVHGYCLDKKKEANRIDIATHYQNLIRNICAGNYEVGIVRAI